MEVLSEHNCQGWLQGYVLTGRHGVFPCYEAFIPIVDGMVNQYGKFLKMSRDEAPWREPVPALNYLLTSVGWRQDHNGYSHQMPGFINSMLNRKSDFARVYLPPDANTLVATMAKCLECTSTINLVIASKHPLPQWLSMDEARGARRGAVRRAGGSPPATTWPSRTSCSPAAARSRRWSCSPPASLLREETARAEGPLRQRQRPLLAWRCRRLTPTACPRRTSPTCSPRTSR